MRHIKHHRGRGKRNARISLSLSWYPWFEDNKREDGYRLKKRGGEKFGRTIIPLFVLFVEGFTLHTVSFNGVCHFVRDF